MQQPHYIKFEKGKKELFPSGPLHTNPTALRLHSGTRLFLNLLYHTCFPHCYELFVW